MDVLPPPPPAPMTVQSPREAPMAFGNSKTDVPWAWALCARGGGGGSEGAATPFAMNCRKIAAPQPKPPPHGAPPLHRGHARRRKGHARGTGIGQWWENCGKNSGPQSPRPPPPPTPPILCHEPLRPREAGRRRLWGGGGGGVQPPPPPPPTPDICRPPSLVPQVRVCGPPTPRTRPAGVPPAAVWGIGGPRPPRSPWGPTRTGPRQRRRTAPPPLLRRPFGRGDGGRGGGPVHSPRHQRTVRPPPPPTDTPAGAARRCDVRAIGARCPVVWGRALRPLSHGRCCCGVESGGCL